MAIRNSIIALLLFVFALPARAEGWNPDTSSLDGNLAFLQAVLKRYPFMLNRNSSYPRDALSVLNPTTQIVRDLGEHANDLRLGDAPTMTMDYVPGGQVDYDDKKLDAMRAALVQGLGKLGDEAHPTLEAHLARLKDTLSPAEFRKQARTLLTLVPFLYDSDGRAHPRSPAQTIDVIRAASPTELENLYFDQFAQHNAAQIDAIAGKKGFGDIQAIFGSVRNTFLDRELKDAVTARYRKIEGLGARRLTLEWVPPLVAVLRGNFGEDCSLHSVPYLPLVKGAQTYWVHRGAGGGEPDGYIIVIPAKVGGKTYPYVVTSNGLALERDDVKAACAMIASRWGVDSVILPDLKKNPHVVNTDTMRAGLGAEGARRSAIELPAGLDVIDRHMENHSTGYTNYYAAAKLGGEAYLAKVATFFPTAEATIAHGAIQAPYAQTHWKDVNEFTRAAVARRLSGVGHAHVDEIAKKLGVTPRHQEIADRLIAASEGAPVRIEAFRAAEGIGFHFDDLRSLDAPARVATLNALKDARPPIGTPEQWGKLLEETFDTVMRESFRHVDTEEAKVKAGLERALALPKIGGFDPVARLHERLLAPGDGPARAVVLDVLTRDAKPATFATLRPILLRLLETKGEAAAMAGVVLLEQRETVHGARAARIALDSLHSENWRVRQRTVVALRKAGWRDDNVDAAVLDALLDADSDVRREAQTAMGELNIDAERRVEMMLQGRTKFFDVKELVAHRPGDPRTARALLGALRRDPSAETMKAIAGLGPNDPEIAREAAKQMFDSSWVVREQAAVVIGKSGSRDPAVVSALVAGWSDGDRDVLNAVKQAMATLEIPPSEWLTILRKHTANLHHAEVLGRIRFLPTLGLDPAVVAAEQIAALSHENYDVRIDALGHLLKHESLDGAHAARLLPALRAERWQERHAAMQLLGKMKTADAAVHLAIARGQYDGDSDVRKAADAAIEHQGTDKKAMARALRAQPGPLPPHEEADVLHATIIHLGDDPETVERLRRLFTAPELADEIVGVLDRVATLDAALVPALTEALAHPAWKTRRYALRLLHRVPSLDDAVALKIAERLTDEDSDVRLAARDTLGRHFAGDRLNELFERHHAALSPAVLRRALELTTRQSDAFLVSALKSGDPDCVHIAIERIYRGKHGNSSALVQAVFQTARAGDERARSFAVPFLAMLEPGTPGVREALAEAAADDNRYIAGLAGKALAKYDRAQTRAARIAAGCAVGWRRLLPWHWGR